MLLLYDLCTDCNEICMLMRACAKARASKSEGAFILTSGRGYLKRGFSVERGFVAMTQYELSCDKERPFPQRYVICRQLNPPVGVVDLLNLIWRPSSLQNRII